MNLENARILTNDFQDTQLLSLDALPGAAALREPGGRGPFVVLQTGIDPLDPRGTVEEFILSKDGRWLALSYFYQLPKDLRREKFLFPSAASVMTTMTSLVGKPAIERGKPGDAAEADETSTASSDQTLDPLNQAINEARKSNPPKS